LFAAIGTVWGASDISHFNVPDLRGRTLINNGMGPGLSNRVPGQTFGEETHMLVTAEMPSHNHSYSSGLTIVTAAPPVVPDALAPNPLPSFTSTEGGGAAHENMQPSAVIVYGIIAG
jgi:microcystin-dependent protein